MCVNVDDNVLFYIILYISDDDVMQMRILIYLNLGQRVIYFPGVFYKSIRFKFTFSLNLIFDSTEIQLENYVVEEKLQIRRNHVVGHKRK